MLGAIRTSGKGTRRKQIRTFWLFAALLLIAGRLAAQSPPQVTLVKSSRLLDPRTGNVLSPAAVLIESGKIKGVGPSAKVQAPSGAKIIDLGNATLLPGLIDSHTHLLLDVVAPAEAERARRFNGGFVPALLLAIVEIAKQASVAGRAEGSGRSGEWHHHGAQSWALRD